MYQKMFCNSMLSDEIQNNELLYRAIKSGIPHHWKKDTNRPTSAVFKDSTGLSVDRKGDRTGDVIISTFQSKFSIKAVISITAEECRNAETLPLAKPLPDNPYHAEIHRNEDNPSLTSGQAKKLSRLARIEYLHHSS